jgi:hypothetical protein
VLVIKYLNGKKELCTAQTFLFAKGICDLQQMIVLTEESSVILVVPKVEKQLCKSILFVIFLVFSVPIESWRKAQSF